MTKITDEQAQHALGLIRVRPGLGASAAVMERWNRACAALIDELDLSVHAMIEVDIRADERAKAEREIADSFHRAWYNNHARLAAEEWVRSGAYRRDGSGT